MTDEERKALVARLRSVDVSWSETGEWCAEAADQIEADGQRIAELEAALKSIEAGTYPRPLGKPWRMDLSSSKHDRCVHDVWMYETCDGCLDAFVRAALGDTQ